MAFDLLNISPSELERGENYISTSIRLKKLNRQQVIKLLGEPDHELPSASGSGVDIFNYDTMYYRIGFLDFGIDVPPDYLVIGFDGSRTVAFVTFYR